MPIKRSQSAPQPIEALFSITKTKVFASSSKDTELALPRSKSYLVENTATNSPISSPRTEREDPFSLGGFFPARVARDDEEQWKWLQNEEDANLDRQMRSPLHIEEEESVLGELEDRLAEETIKHEDKFGVLSLSEFFYVVLRLLHC